MTDAPDLEPAALEAAHDAYDASQECQPREHSQALSEAIRAYLAARSAPEAGKAVEEEPIGWAYQDKRWDKGRWHVCGLDSKPRAHEGREIRAIYIASNGGALASSPAPTGADPVAPTGEIAGLRRMSDAHREHAQSAVEHNATLNRLLSIAEARADRLEAEVADLRRKLEEAEQKAERQWEGWVREEVARKAAERKLEDAREALEWQPVETAPKGTIVNVVGRYKHATAGYPRYAALNEEVNEWFEYSKHKPEPLVVWAWRPREEWPDESAAPLPEDTHHG